MGDSIVRRGDIGKNYLTFFRLANCACLLLNLSLLSFSLG